MKIEGSVAVVFGAARGIGLAYTKALLERGASVSQTLYFLFAVQQIRIKLTAKDKR